MKFTSFGDLFDSQEYLLFLDKKSSSNQDRINSIVSFIPDLMEEALTDCQKEIIYDYYFKELNITQIAKLHGVNKSTICRTKKRAERKLIRYLKYYSFR